MAGRINDKKITVDNNNSIQKSNELSMVKMNQGLTLNQTQLLAYAIYATQQGNTTMFIKADFERKFGIGQYRPNDAKDDVSKLMDIKFSQLDLEHDKFKFWNVFQEIDYEKGTFSFKWTDRMLPHITDLKEKYLLTDLTITSRFASNFSWILYDYLRAKYGCWYITLNKDELMDLFGVEDVPSYKNNTSVFKRKVLDNALSEINKYTELVVTYDEVKEGNSIVGFKLKWSTGKKVKKASKKQAEILNSIVDTIFSDVPMYMEIKDQTNRSRALSIIRELQQVQADYLYSDVGLTADKCSELTTKANDGLEALNYLLENEGKELLKPKVPLHNWLKD